MRCFECGAIILNVNVPCAKCGYRFSAGDDECPNKTEGICNLTGKECDFNGHINFCPIKAEADREIDF